MKNLKTTLLALASVVALSQPAIANDTVQLKIEASVALNSILADNVAEIKSVNVTKSADQTIAKLETQLRNNRLAQEAVKSLPHTTDYKVVIAD